MSNMNVRAMKMQHDVDPKQSINDDLKDFVGKYRLVNPYEVLLAVYDRGAGKKSGEVKTLSGIILPGQSTDEDKWQGIVGLVVKKGSLAFTDDETHKWDKDSIPQINDWVTFKVGEAHPFIVGERMVRLIHDSNIRGIWDGDPSELM